MHARFSLLVIVLIAASSFATTDFEQIAKHAEEAQSSDRLIEAISLYQQALHLRPTWSAGWWSLGSVLYDEDRFPEAETAFQHFVAIGLKPGPGYAFLALCEYETRHYDHALQHFRMWASRGWSGTPELVDVAVFHFALLLTRDGGFAQALYLLTAEVEKSHSGPTLTEAMGLASLHMRNVPEDYPQEDREMVWLAGKAAYYAAIHPSDFQTADEYAHQLALHYDKTPNVHYFLGTLVKFEDKDDEAAAQFQRELQISPKHGDARIGLARLDLADHQLDAALAMAKSACDLEPQSPEAHQIRGQVLLTTGDFAESARELEIAKRLAPDSAPVRFQLATAYRKMNRSSDADRETAAFNLLKDKQLVMASPAEKLGNEPDLLK